jgi:sugar lactone lactonase YvrE
MALETFQAGYAGARPPRTGLQWSGMWKLSQNVDRIVDDRWPQPWGLAGARSDFPMLNIAGQEPSATDLQFKSDGTKFYIVGLTNNTVYQYSCAIPWDVNTAIYDSKSFSVAAQETSPRALFFKSDGTKFYIVGFSNNTVYQYSCSTAWDVSTASYDSKSFSVNAQDTNTTGLFFKPDGTKFYIVGYSNDTVYQYSCSTAWDVNTASYDSKSFSVTAQENAPQALFFKSDGTKFYIVGTTNRTVYQYSCSTAWDVSTASYDSKLFSVTNQETNPQGLFFKDDGTKFYIVGPTNDTVYQYSLSTPWDISTGSRAAFYIGGQEATASDVQFKDDGTKFYIVGTTNDTVYQYSCSTAWDVSTASYDSKSFSIAAQEINSGGLFFKSDGTKFYIVGTTNDTVYQYSCSTAWDVSTASYDSKSFSVNAQDNTPAGLFFKDDGIKFYIVGITNDTVYQYSCSTAWDVSTASYDSKSFSIAAQEINSGGLFFKSDGTKFYIVGTTNDTVYQYSCSTAWDVSTASYDSKSFSIATQDNTATGLFFKSDGTKFYIVGTTNDTVYQYSLLLE